MKEKYEYSINWVKKEKSLKEMHCHHVKNMEYHFLQISLSIVNCSRQKIIFKVAIGDKWKKMCFLSWLFVPKPYWIEKTGGHLISSVWPKKSLFVPIPNINNFDSAWKKPKCSSKDSLFISPSILREISQPPRVAIMKKVDPTL